MAQSETISIGTTREAAECIANGFGSEELRALASNAGVSRERGDTKMSTAVRLAEQDPALAARVLEADDEVDMEASAFREAREVGGETVSLEEAAKRARHSGMARKLKELADALRQVPRYDCEVEWEYGGRAEEGGYEPGLTSVSIKTDAEMSPLLKERALILLTPHGRATTLQVAGEDYTEKGHSPSTAWSLALRRIERFYDPDE